MGKEKNILDTYIENMNRRNRTTAKSPAAAVDPVDHPAHYKQGKWEVIDIIEGMNMTDFREGNILKYLFRYKYKNGLEDLKKARFYLNRLIDKYEKLEKQS